MIANKIILNGLLKRKASASIAPAASYATGGWHDEKRPIGKREWVGYGINASPHYCDRPDYPLPAVRFREITGDLIPLREKEKGDWKNLSLEEKKKLYRASFRQTLAEVEAPSGEWKSIFGWTFFFCSVGLWLYILEKQFMYKPKPESFSDEWRAKMLRKMIDNKMGHLSGVSSKWDYEKDDWKK